MDQLPTTSRYPININRKIYTQSEIEEEFPKKRPEQSGLKFKCSPKCVLDSVLTYLPIIRTVKSYNRRSALNDFLAGISVAFMHLPQGLGFGLLASLKPIHGLYSTIYPVLLYLLFGTSPHVSIGTNAVMAVITASVVEREAKLWIGLGNNHTVITDEEILQYKVGISMMLTFLAGAILSLMGLLKLGFLTNYLAVSFIGGFTTVSAIHITTSQIGKMLNIDVKPYSGAGKIIKSFIEIFSNIKDTNFADLIISIVSIAILLIVKVLVNERYKARLKIPIPIDLVVVVLSTIISYVSNLKDVFGVAIVGDVPTGMPLPVLPNFESAPRVAKDSFVVAILIFALTISMAKLMARMNNYELNNNQELVAYGMSNLFSSFFQCFPACVSPPRTMLLNDLNSKTTLNAITSAIFIIIILLVAGPLFQALPVAVLAAMIVVAMKDLLLQFRNLPNIWRVSKSDFVVWVMTVLIGVFVDLDISILVGVGLSILSVIIQNQLVRGYPLVQIPDNGILLDHTFRRELRDQPGVRIFNFESQLYFVNAERFRNLLHTTIVNPAHVPQRRSNQMFTSKSAIYIPEDANQSAEEEMTNGVSEEIPLSDKDNEELIRFIIINCVNMTYIDMSGVNILKHVLSEYNNARIQLLLANVPTYMFQTLEKSDFFKLFPPEYIYFDVIDALEAIKL